MKKSGVMAGSATAMRASEDNGTTDPFAAAKEKLFPPLRHRILAQAADALAENRADVAEPLVSTFLKKHPTEPGAVNLMADIARRAGQFDKAEELLSKCIQQSPDCAGYKFNYAVILRNLGRFEQALVQLDTLLVTDPKNPLVRDQKAKVLHDMGRNADAVAYRRGLSSDHPAWPQGWLGYGDSLKVIGAFDECVLAYRKALELAPRLTTVYSRLLNLKTYRFTVAEIESMQEQVASSGLSGGDRAGLHFALGKAYGDEGSYAKSFDHYAKGNAIRRLGLEFAPEGLTTYRLSCQSLFTETFFRARIGWGCASGDPIFIVGMPRSGSTLVEQILCSHSAVEGLQELTDLDVIVGKRFSGAEGGKPHDFWIGGWFEFKAGLARALPRVLNALGEGDVRSIGDEYLTLTRRRRRFSKSHFTDKELRNFGYVGLIHLILPKAKIVDVRRHPLDCGWSCFKSDFPRGQPFSCRLGDIGRYYANYVALMEHFDRVLPGRIHRVNYENLVANPEGEVSRLLDYLGLPFEEQCLRFHETGRAVNTLSSQQVRMPLYKSAIGQWRPYEPWLGALKTALGPVLEKYPQVPE